jgi:hypothetical protein
LTRRFDVKAQDWIFTVRYSPEGVRDRRRFAVVGPARASTVEAALHLAKVPEGIRSEIRSNETVRKFVDGQLDPERMGYYTPCPLSTAANWVVCIGSIQEVIR